jgi:ligand-binding sensor domain-containing protein
MERCKPLSTMQAGRSLLFTAWIASALMVQAQSWETFDMANAGLPSNTITDVAIDGQDRVWVGTDWGLCHFDGSSWTVFQADNSGLPDNLVNTVAVDSTDRVWVGTVLSGVTIFDGSNWQTFNSSNSGLPDNEIKCITIDHRGWAWIGTYLGLVCYTGSEWRLYNDSDTSYNGLRLHGNVIEDVAVRSDGLVSVGTLNGGFHYLSDTSVFVYSSFVNQFPDNTQSGVVFDAANDERWLACPAGGLLRQGGAWAGGPWFQYTTQNSGIPTNTLLAIDVDPQGRVWLGTSLAGVAVRNTNGTFVNYTSFNSDLPDNTVQTIRVAHNGDIWAGTYYGGVARLQLSTDLNGAAPLETLHVYPNPATDHVQVCWPEVLGPVQWELRDTQGRVVWERGSTSGASAYIGLDEQAPGTYFLCARSGEKLLRTTVVKH